MQHVSSLGGPRVLLPTQDVERWINQLGDANPSDGLYGLACSVHGYCGIIRPWETPILVFGDLPSDIYWSPREQRGGLFIRWVGADSLEQLTKFAIGVADEGRWTERIEWDAQFTNYTLMDTCTFAGDHAAKIAIELPVGKYVVESQYAESNDVMTIVHNLRDAA